MVGNIHNVVTDLMEHLGCKESDFPWEWRVNQDIGILEIRLNTDILPSVVRRPIMVCKLHFSKYTTQEPQILFVEKNTLFQGDGMTRVLEFLSMHPVDVV